MMSFVDLFFFWATYHLDNDEDIDSSDDTDDEDGAIADTIKRKKRGGLSHI